MFFDYNNLFAAATTSTTTALAIPVDNLLVKCVLSVFTGLLTWCLTTALSLVWKKLHK